MNAELERMWQVVSSSQLIHSRSLVFRDCRKA